MFKRKQKENDLKFMNILNILLVVALVIYFIVSGLNAVSSLYYYTKGLELADAESHRIVFEAVRNTFLVESLFVALYFVVMSIINGYLYTKQKNKPLFMFLVAEFWLAVFLIVFFGEIINAMDFFGFIRSSMVLIMPVIVFIYGGLLYLRMPEKKKLFGRKK